MPASFSISIPQYLTRVKGIIYTHLSPILEPRRVVKRFPSNGQTNLFIEVPFRDRSLLRALESLLPNSGGFSITQYSYEYKRPSGYFFQFERESTADYKSYISESGQEIEQIYKPRTHLHVGAAKDVTDALPGFPGSLREHDGPHYLSPDVSLDYVLCLIVVNYYQNEIADVGFLDLSDFMHS